MIELFSIIMYYLFTLTNLTGENHESKRSNDTGCGFY